MDIFDDAVKRINVDMSNYIAREIEVRLSNQLLLWGTLDYAKEIAELKQKLNSQLEYIHSLESELEQMRSHSVNFT